MLWTPKYLRATLSKLQLKKKEYKGNVIEKAREIMRKAHEAIDENRQSKDILDIAVSFDGTGKKRVISSLYL